MNRQHLLIENQNGNLSLLPLVEWGRRNNLGNHTETIATELIRRGYTRIENSQFVIYVPTTIAE